MLTGEINLGPDLLDQIHLIWPTIVMIVIGLALIYLAVSRGMEPLLLIPIGSGIVLANLFSGLVEDGGLFYLLKNIGMETKAFPLLMFLGLGALTDFSGLLQRPYVAFLAAAAQIGIFGALIGAVMLGFDLSTAAGIAVIGGADGPTAIYVSTLLAPESLWGPIAVSAYSYMALVPIIQPPIMRLLTTEGERRVRMGQLAPVRREIRIMFPIMTTLLIGVLAPQAVPLVGLMMFGNLLRESGVTERLAGSAQNEMINIVTILLGLTVGSTMAGDTFLEIETLKVFAVGLLAFIMATTGGVLFGKIIYVVSGKTVNPLLGAAGVSAVPMSARAVHKVAQEADPDNFLVMHAMGPNVAGVIGSAVAAGVLLSLLS